MKCPKKSIEIQQIIDQLEQIFGQGEHTYIFEKITITNFTSNCSIRTKCLSQNTISAAKVYHCSLEIGINFSCLIDQ